MSNLSVRAATSRARSASTDLAGIGAGALVLTLDGEIPVQHLAVGDRIITRSGARSLKSLRSRMIGGGFILAPHTLGHDRPETEVTVGPTQTLLLRDWRARALYGTDQAVVPVARLLDGEYIAAAPGPVRLWQLGFDQAEVIYAGGLEMAVPAP